jgi:hypothetical protein
MTSDVIVCSLFNDTFSVTQMFSVEWRVENEWCHGKYVKGSGRAKFKVLSQHFPGDTEENHKKSQSRYEVFRMRLKTTRPRCSVYLFSISRHFNEKWCCKIVLLLFCVWRTNEAIVSQEVLQDTYLYIQIMFVRRLKRRREGSAKFFVSSGQE